MIAATTHCPAAQILSKDLGLGFAPLIVAESGGLISLSDVFRLHPSPQRCVVVHHEKYPEVPSSGFGLFGREAFD